VVVGVSAAELIAVGEEMLGGRLIATGSFPGTPAITAATAYALFQTVVTALVALRCGRLSSATGGVAQRART
jgi:hypothetical protein